FRDVNVPCQLPRGKFTRCSANGFYSITIGKNLEQYTHKIIHILGLDQVTSFAIANVIARSLAVAPYGNLPQRHCLDVHYRASLAPAWEAEHIASFDLGDCFRMWEVAQKDDIRGKV